MCTPSATSDSGRRRHCGGELRTWLTAKGVSLQLEFQTCPPTQV